VATFLKTLVILVLAAGVFGGGGYFTYLLFVKPDVELQKELQSPGTARPAIEDTTLPEFQKCLVVEAAGDPLATRRSFLDFVDAYPDSPNSEEARFRVGKIQADLLFAPRMTPEKRVYNVRAGDGIQRVSQRLKCPIDLFLALNRLEGTALKVGQRLMYIPSDFSVEIDRRMAKVVVYWQKQFFGQYRILETQGSAQIGPGIKKGTPPSTVKVGDKPGWIDGKRVSGLEAATAGSRRWIVVHSSVHTLYGLVDASEDPAPKPSSGYGVSSDAIRLLAVVLNKNDAILVR
jgi:hypothetical protein